MIFFHKNQIYEMVSMAEAIDAMKEAFIQLSRGEAFVPQRANLNIPDKNATCLVMPAYAMGSPYYSVKTVSINYSNPDKGLPLIHAVVQVFDAEKGISLPLLMGNPLRPFVRPPHRDWPQICWQNKMQKFVPFLERAFRRNPI